LVQHLDPTHKSLLAELLSSCTDMPVLEADHGIELRPDTVYIIRPDTALGVRCGRIELSVPTLHRGVRLPVDHLFRALAREYGARAVAIVLSGAGSDGSSGLRDIKAAGGLTIAQNPDFSIQPGMPLSAIDTGAIDLVLPIGEMPQALERFASLPSDGRSPAPERPSAPSKVSEEAMRRVTALLEAQRNFDLRVYKYATIERRMLRRMALSGFETVDAYFEHLQESPVQQQALIGDLLISVTDFFRDPMTFSALRELVIDPLLDEAASGTTLRVWVTGCAT